jgi:hypothetical protein
VWKRGGVYDTWREHRWAVSMPSFVHHRDYRFTTLGHSWTVSLGVGLWRHSLEVSVSVIPDKLLSTVQVNRLHSLGFYEDVKELFSRMGYGKPWIGIRGNAYFAAQLRGVSEIARYQRQYENLYIGSRSVKYQRRVNAKGKQRLARELLEWGRQHRRSGWAITLLELSVLNQERGAGVSWRTRRDVLLSLVSSCTWLYVYAPRAISGRAFRNPTMKDFFRRSAAGLEKIHHRGRWFPQYLTGSDRMIAEFWRPQRRGPQVSWKAFHLLRNWRLANY